MKILSNYRGLGRITLAAVALCFVTGVACSDDTTTPPLADKGFGDWTVKDSGPDTGIPDQKITPDVAAQDWAAPDMKQGDAKLTPDMVSGDGAGDMAPDTSPYSPSSSPEIDEGWRLP